MTWELPERKFWDSPAEDELDRKVRKADLVISASIAPYESSVWKSSDLLEVIGLRNVEVDLYVLEVYSADKNMDAKYAFEVGQNRQINVNLLTALLYTSEYATSVGELRAQVDDFISEFWERWKKLRSEYSAKHANQDEYHAKLAELDNWWFAHRFGTLTKDSAGIVLAPYSGPIDAMDPNEKALCGLPFLSAGENYIFFLRSSPDGFELTGRQSVLPGSFDPILRKVLAEAPPFRTEVEPGSFVVKPPLPALGAD